jgi:hypothetical protein
MAAPGALPAALRRVHACLELQYTGPSATRPLYADFLDEAAIVLGESGLTRAAALFRTSAEHWSAVASRALAAAESADGDAGGSALLGELAEGVDAARVAEQGAATVMAETARRRPSR